jgi:hypothetical protein
MLFHDSPHVSPEFGDFIVQNWVDYHGLGFFLVTGVFFGLVKIVEEAVLEIVGVSFNGHGAGV